ncbi:hypothetical protein FRB95_006938 [Tulasnella sp. JGI-2019a]|nr:hypothetical protein FRB95_006938 [Tulasnella sp. JGI-2019a]
MIKLDDDLKLKPFDPRGRSQLGINYPIRFADDTSPLWPNINVDLERSVPESEGDLVAERMRLTGATYESSIPAIQASDSGLRGENTLSQGGRN